MMDTTLNQSRTVLISEQFKGFTVVNVPLTETVRFLAEEQKRFGPVTTCSLKGIRQVIDLLSPVKSFTTRYAAIQLDGWTCLLTDMKGENCSVNGFALSRMCGCNAFAVSLWQERRELQVFERGEKVREIQSLLDGDRWYYRECGSAQWFEDTEKLAKRKKSERLAVTALETYWEKYTGIEVPVWSNLKQNDAAGVERSLKELRVEIIHYKTHNDL